jgi:hypothetical protein
LSFSTATEHPGQAAGAAWKNVDARKTKMAARVRFSRWILFGGGYFRQSRNDFQECQPEFALRTELVFGDHRGWHYAN